MFTPPAPTKIRPDHLSRVALIYIRQSTLLQVREHTASTARQYDLAQPGAKWHLDEVFLKINGQTHYLWRAVDQYGNVRNSLVTSKRDKQAATRFFRQRRKGCQCGPRVIISDTWRSYGVAKHELLPGGEHRPRKGLNNRAENSHQPTRQKARQLRHFKSGGHAQRLPSAFEPMRGPFRLRRHQRPAAEVPCGA